MDEEMNNPTSRNSMQKVAMTAIYDVLTYRSMGLDADVRGIVSGLCDLPYEECDYFVKAAVAAFNAKMRGWTFDRRNRVEQSILLLAYVHYFFVEPDVDKGVVIDIAVKQAKVFLEDKDFKFVNAILDNVLVHAQ